MSLNTLLQEEPPRYLFPEISPPKGHKFKKETPLETALRETQEETGFKINEHFKIFHHTPVISDCFIGTNGILYNHLYFLAEFHGQLRLGNNFSITDDEIHKYFWGTLDELHQHIRPYEKTKLQLFEEAFKLAESHDFIKLEKNSIEPTDLCKI